MLIFRQVIVLLMVLESETYKASSSEPVLIELVFQKFPKELSATQMLHQQYERKKIKSEYSFISKTKRKQIKAWVLR